MSEQVIVAEVRMQGRVRRRRTALMARIFVCALAIAVGVGLLFAALVAGTRIRHVTVISRDRGLAAEVSRSLQIPPWANLITSKLSRIADQACRLPKVKSVDFRRKFPDRLILTVEPREPCMAFEKGGRFLLVDDEGLCTEWTPRPDRGLLRVKGMGVKADAGQRISGKWFERSLLVARTVAPADQHEPWTFDVHYPPELSVETGSGARGLVGNSPDLGRRVGVFIETLDEYKRQGRRIGLMELRTDQPITWTEEHRPDKATATD